MTHEDSDPGVPDPLDNYDGLDDASTLIFWGLVVTIVCSFLFICWLLYVSTKAEPYAVVGREIRRYQEGSI